MWVKNHTTSSSPSGPSPTAIQQQQQPSPYHLISLSSYPILLLWKIQSLYNLRWTVAYIQTKYLLEKDDPLSISLEFCHGIWELESFFSLSDHLPEDLKGSNLLRYLWWGSHHLEIVSSILLNKIPKFWSPYSSQWSYRLSYPDRWSHHQYRGSLPLIYLKPHACIKRFGSPTYSQNSHCFRIFEDNLDYFLALLIRTVDFGNPLRSFS